MDVLHDGIVAFAQEKGWESPWVMERARKELDVLEHLLQSDLPGAERCRRLIEAIRGEVASVAG